MEEGKMSVKFNTGVVALFNRISIVAGALVIIIGLLVLTGWMFNITVLKSILPGLIEMNPATAISFILSAVSLLLLYSEQIDKRRRLIGQFFAFAVILIALIRLYGYIFGAEIGIDQILFWEHLGDNRMAPNTAFNFCLIGLSLLLLDVESKHGYRPAQFLVIIAFLISILALLGYVYGVKQFIGIARYIGMALPTASAFIIICLGILSIRPRQGIMTLVTSDNMGGILIRRLLPVAILAPFILGWIRLLGEQADIFSSLELGVASLVLAITIVFTVLLWRSARLVYRIDAERNLAEEQLRERTAQLETANKELEAFSYSVSHDLRAPLRAIDGFSRMIIEDYANRLDDEGKRLLNVIRKNTQNMGQLIDDLLAFSRIGRKEIVRDEINMAELAKTVFDELKPQAKQDTTLKLDGLPSAYGDRALMRQVFVNLLSNSLKFTRSRNEATIEIGCKKEGDKNVYFVRDNGVGFDMMYINKLFGVFQRLHSVDEFEGTGVGLAIVHRIIHRHNGEVRAEGKVGEGAVFYFSIPLKEKE